MKFLAKLSTKKAEEEFAPMAEVLMSPEQRLVHSVAGLQTLSQSELTNESAHLSHLVENCVEEYLQSHPRFFEDKEPLLSSMLLSHPQTGQTISLLERQLMILRQRSNDYQTQVSEIVDHASANTETFAKIEQFSVQLMKTTHPQQAVDVLYQQMQVLFGVDETSLHSFDLPSESVSGLIQLGMDSRWTDALCYALKPNKPICGPLEAEWRKGLFYQHKEIASVCIIPLGETKVWGVLALGSLDLKFMGDETLFLKFIGKMVTAKLEHLFLTE